jgi:hypothetical protein
VIFMSPPTPLGCAGSYVRGSTCRKPGLLAPDDAE